MRSNSVIFARSSSDLRSFGCSFCSAIKNQTGLTELTRFRRTKINSVDPVNSVSHPGNKNASDHSVRGVAFILFSG